ncbi:glucokinase [Bartonella sp. LJL80]
MRDMPLNFPVLIGDIGGTNARFSIIPNAVDKEQSFSNLAVADFPSINAAIAQEILSASKVKPKSLLLAIAGPVDGSEIAMTNSHWTIKPQELIEELGFQQVFVINDFEAQALATTALAEKYLQPIGEVKPVMEATKVILGPGTGLGVAGLIHLDDQFIPFPGEGGHVDFAPQSARDLALLPYLKKGSERVSAEELLSGRGLVNIYNAICKVDGKMADFSTPDAITAAALETAHRQAHETVVYFLTYLARLAGDFALTFKALGGVYIGGGITPKLANVINHREFRNIFENKSPHQDVLKKTATVIMTHPRAALVGMDSYVRHPERYLLDKTDRFWTSHSS